MNKNILKEYCVWFERHRKTNDFAFGSKIDVFVEAIRDSKSRGLNYMLVNSACSFDQYAKNLNENTVDLFIAFKQYSCYNYIEILRKKSLPRMKQLLGISPSDQ